MENYDNINNEEIIDDSEELEIGEPISMGHASGFGWGMAAGSLLTVGLYYAGRGIAKLWDRRKARKERVKRSDIEYVVEDQED